VYAGIDAGRRLDHPIGAVESFAQRLAGRRQRRRLLGRVHLRLLQRRGRRALLSRRDTVATTTPTTRANPAITLGQTDKPLISLAVRVVFAWMERGSTELGFNSCASIRATCDHQRSCRLGAGLNRVEPTELRRQFLNARRPGVSGASTEHCPAPPWEFRRVVNAFFTMNNVFRELHQMSPVLLHSRRANMNKLAIAALGIVAVDLTQSRADMSAAAQVAARFPHAHEIIIPLAKSDRMPASGCSREHWPYIADECLATTGRTNAPRPARRITIERRIAENASQLVRVEATMVASR